jgi:NAD(P)H-dependent flavin oxidoreductase YrpB (nitropropane dioxygenase family)
MENTIRIDPNSNRWNLLRRRSIDPRHWPVGPALDLRAPLVQAPLGVCGGPLLAAAVSRAGALGCLTVHAPDPTSLRRQLARTRQRTAQPVLLAFTAPFVADALLDVAFANGFHHFQTFWWNGPSLTPRIRRRGGRVLWQVGSAEETRIARDAGTDIFVAAGTDGGGPVRTPLSMQELISTIRDSAGDDAVIVAGGGLATRADVAAALQMGAAAALLGTRFLLSEEARSPARAKARLARATEEDLVLDTRIGNVWPCAPRRRLATAHAFETPTLFAGRGVGRIDRVLTAIEIVRSLTP